MSDAVDISIVVAAVNAADTLGPWLEAIRPQAVRHHVEILVAAAADDHAVAVDEPGGVIRVVTGGPAALVPALWGIALLEARAPIVAVTITACVPAADWLDAIAAAHREAGADGVGGVIDCAPSARTTDRALHLVRYTPYLPPVAAGPVEEIAGDNGTYTRAALERWRSVIERDGFWESEFHRVLRAGGGSLRIDPRIRVTHTRSYSFAAFCGQRFRHGRIFGRARATGLSMPARLARLALTPAVPAIMLGRALRTVADRGRLDAGTVIAAPAAAWFLCCWAAGEAVGLLRG